MRGAWIEMADDVKILLVEFWSLPVRGAWIEIACNYLGQYLGRVSLPVRGAWIEIQKCTRRRPAMPSLPVRGAWIEIRTASAPSRAFWVAPRAGSVD